MRCDKYNDYVKVVPCPARPPRRRPEGLRRGRDQIRVRLHVYKVKAADLPNIGSDNPEVAWPASWLSCGLWWPVPAEGPAAAGSVSVPLGAPSPDSCGRGMCWAFPTYFFLHTPSRSNKFTTFPSHMSFILAFHVKHLEAINQRGTGGARGAHGGGDVPGP